MEPMMAIRALILLSALLINLTLPISVTLAARAAGHEPCPISQNDWGFWQINGDCWFLEKPLQVTSPPPPSVLEAGSELEPASADIDIGGGEIIIDVKIQTIGHADSSDFEVEVGVGMLHGVKNVGPNAILMQQAQNLRVGDDHGEHIGIARLDYRDSDIVALSARVEGARGNIEEDEMNILPVASCTIDLSNAFNPCDD